MTDRAASAGETDQLLQTAVTAQRQGRAAEAARLFERVITQDPSNPIALNGLGMLALARKDFAAARTHFSGAASADPAAPQLWINLATAARQLGDDAAEHDALTRALAIEQRQIVVHVRLGELHERREEPARAAHHWSAVVMLAEQIADPPPELAAVVARARGFVGERSASFADAIDQGLSVDRDGLSRTELRRFDACIDALLGRRRIYSNDCQGLRFPFLPADEFFDRAHFPWMPALEAETSHIRDELEALISRRPDAFTPYVEMDAGTPDNIWSNLNHSLDWSALHIWRHGRIDEAAAAQCPATVTALARVPQPQLPGRSPTAFFSVLKPHTRIPPHGGVTNTRATVHLPLIVPPGCGFRVGGEVREWRVGEAFAFDDTIEHEAWNDSDQPRAVLIFDVWNPHLSAVEQQLLQRFFDVADASGHNPLLDG